MPRRSDQAPDRGTERTHAASGHKWAAIVCAATIILAIGAPLIGRGIFLASDVVRIYQPWKADTPSTFVYRHGPINDTIDSITPQRLLLRDSIADGHFQLWDPYPNGGTPLGSTPGLGLLSPLNWPLLLLGVRLGSAWSALLRLALAAGATFAFLRRLRLTRVAAVCGGLIYCTSGFIVAWNNWPQANVAAWIPALFLAFDVLLEHRTRARRGVCRGRGRVDGLRGLSARHRRHGLRLDPVLDHSMVGIDTPDV